MTTALEDTIRALALTAQEASVSLAQTTTDKRNEALQAMAQALRDHTEEIVAANAMDVQAAQEANTKASLIDRLLLDEGRIEAMACALEELKELPDPLGQVTMASTLANGIDLKRVTVPLGVVAMVYEARPNVTADAAGICIKSGNACILRGGSLAAHSNEVVSDVLATAVESVGLPRASICAITTTDRAATDVLMSLRGIVDVLIPRGGAGLIQHCVECAKVPVIETGTGNCHVYINETADPDKAINIVHNAKCRRYGVCNAAETLLIDQSIAAHMLPALLQTLWHEGVIAHCDEQAYAIAEATKATLADQGLDMVCAFDHATDDDWATEYLAPEIAVRCVRDYNEAIDHINTYGTLHSEAIVADPESESGRSAIEAFVNRVDAAAVYVNASTAFTDGGQFGLGAEIGISTQKIHVRGPFALEALTSYKYILRGNGQVRS